MLRAATSLTLLFLTVVQGCMRSSLYYRAQTRTRSHVFAPGEYQPRQWEHTVEGSGPLDSRDFQHSVPNKWLVRVESPLIVFDTEEARWMTEGCRDRLIKLATQVQNTWANHNIKLRVLRGWLKPPPNHKPLNPTDTGTVRNTEGHGTARGGAGETLLFDSSKRLTIQQPQLHHQVRTTVPHYRLPNRQQHATGQLTYTQDRNRNMHIAEEVQPFVGPIIDMSPEMLVDDELPKRPLTNRFRESGVNRFPTFQMSTQSVPKPPGPYRLPWRSSQWSNLKQAPTPTRNYRLSNSDYFKQLPASSLPLRQPRDANPSLLNSSTEVSGTTPLSPRLIHRSADSMEFHTSNRHSQLVSSMSQTRFDQWLDMRMEEFHYAGRAVDLQLTRISYTSPGEVNLGVLAQIAYYVAQFDWCYYSRSGRIHCSVKAGKTKAIKDRLISVMEVNANVQYGSVLITIKMTSNAPDEEKKID